MKRILSSVAMLMVALQLCQAVTLPDLPEIVTKQAASGKYGFYDGNKQSWLTDAIFDEETAFFEDALWTEVKYQGHTYVVDRNFNVIKKVDEVFSFFDNYASFVLVSEGSVEHVIGLDGKKLSDDYDAFQFINRIKNDSWPRIILACPQGSMSCHLFSLVDFKPLGSVAIDGSNSKNNLIYDLDESALATHPGVIRFKDGANPQVKREGVINLDGEVLLPARHYAVDIDYIPVYDKLQEALLKAGVSSEDINNMPLVVGRDYVDGKIDFTIYDIAGNVIVPTYRCKKVDQKYDKNAIKLIVGYMRNFKEHQSEQYARAYNPYKNYMARLRQANEARYASYRPNKSTNILAMERQRVAQEKRQTQLTAQRERKNASKTSSKSSSSHTTTKSTSSRSTQSSAASHVPLPSYGDYPSDIDLYYKSRTGAVTRLRSYYVKPTTNGMFKFDGGYTVSLTGPLGATFREVNQEITRQGDCFVFASKNQYYNIPALYISQDWSWIKQGDVLFDIPITKQQYDNGVMAYRTAHPQEARNADRDNADLTRSYGESRSSSSGSGGSTSRKARSNSSSGCSVCHGTRINPRPSTGGNRSSLWAHYNPVGTVCTICNQAYEHHHTRCLSCSK